MTRPKKTPPPDWRKQVLVYIEKEKPEYCGEAYQHLFPDPPPPEGKDYLGAAFATITEATSKKSRPELFIWKKHYEQPPAVVIFSRALFIGMGASATPFFTPHRKGLSAPETATALRRAIEDFPEFVEVECRAAIERVARLYDLVPHRRPKRGKARHTLELLVELFGGVFGPGEHHNQALEAFTRHFSGWSPGTAIRTRRKLKIKPQGATTQEVLDRLRKKGKE